MSDEDSARAAALELHDRFGCDVVVTGLAADDPGSAVDLLVTGADEAATLAHPLVQGVGDVRGTGCMLATSLACHLATGLPAREALASAHQTLFELLGNAVPIGGGRRQVDLAAL